MLKAHQARDQFRGHTEVEHAAWLRRILANTLTDLVRQYGAAARDIELEQSLQAGIEDSSARLEAWLVSGVATPGDQAARQEELLWLADALAQLPEDQRQPGGTGRVFRGDLHEAKGGHTSPPRHSFFQNHRGRPLQFLDLRVFIGPGPAWPQPARHQSLDQVSRHLFRAESAIPSANAKAGSPLISL